MFDENHSEVWLTALLSAADIESNTIPSSPMLDMAPSQNGLLTPAAESDCECDRSKGHYRPRERPFNPHPAVKVRVPDIRVQRD